MTRPIVALDTPSLTSARDIVDRLGDACDFYKVGLQLFAAEGPRAVEWLRTQGKSVFVDLKAYDIPNTVKGLAESVARCGASLVTVHAAGGEAMVRAAIDGAGAQDGAGCGVLVVTVLTSFDAASYGAAVGRPGVDVGEEVARMARMAANTGAHGVVCSAREAGSVRDAHPGLRVLVPGVRAAGGPVHDQARAATAAEVRAAGAAYAVLGRAVTAAADPVGAFLELRAELSGKEPKNPLPQVT